MDKRRALGSSIDTPTRDPPLQTSVVATIRRVTAQELDGKTGTVQSADMVAYFR